MKKKFKLVLFQLSWFLFIFPSDVQCQEKPFVTCDIHGQLGNQLNIISSALAYAWDHETDAFFPDLNKDEYNISYNRERFFFRLNTSSLPRPVLNHFNEYMAHGWWNYAPIPYQPDLHLYGDFFCWKYFHHYKERLVELYAPSQEINDYLQTKYKDLLDNPSTVSVHVRTYFPGLHDSWAPFIGLDYYEKAFALFPDDTLFVVFSDRINWCKHHFAQFNKNFIFIEDNDHLQDFFLMSRMKHHILCNSAFSWWSSYLDTNPHSVVVAPRYWYRIAPIYPFYPPAEDNRLGFSSWLLIDANWDTPYPIDIRDYDAESKSIDTQ
jgi:Glycosyl transferase family 11